jgi:hypothetical protein
MSLLLVILALLASQQQIRDAQIAQTGTAALTGTVMTDGPKPEPVRRALVTVTIGPQTSRQWQTSTDDRGRFALAGLAAGAARVVVSKPAWVTTYYGARRAGSTLGVPVALTEGQTTDIKVPLTRGSVISGTVFDERGRPMPGVPVRVLQVVTSPTGRRSFSTYSNSALVPPTDDRGGYRIFGLPAGTFIVSAQHRLSGHEVRQSTQAELQWAERVIAGASAASNPTSAAPDRGPSVTYATVYHPATTRLADAGVITLTTAEERRGIDFRMQFTVTARVQGTVTHGDGRPASGVPVSLVPKDAETPDAARQLILMEVGMAGGGMQPTAPNGSFVLAGIEPGDYYVLARTGVGGRGAGAGGERLWAMTEIRVDGRDVNGLALQLVPTASLSGRVVFDGTSPAPAPGLTTALRAVDGRGFSTQAPSAPPAADGAFRLDGVVPATYRLSATMPGWTMRTAVLNGRDIADSAFDVPAAGVDGLVVTLTNRPAEVTGVLYDAAGRPTSDLSIVLVGADPSMWFPGSRRTRPIVRPATDGRFTFGSLVAGDYLLAALTDVTAADLTDPEFLREVAAAAIKITVADGERKTQDLRIK